MVTVTLLFSSFTQLCVYNNNSHDFQEFNSKLKKSKEEGMSDSEGEAYEKQVKIVLVGDGSSGKV